MMENVLLIRYGELHLKGLNRPFFERKLIERIKSALSGMNAQVRREQGRIFVFGIDPSMNEQAVSNLKRVFGIHSVSPSVGVNKDWNTIKQAACSLMERALAANASSTFKVYSKRSDKQFELNSVAICRELGGYLLSRFPKLSVDVHSPDIQLCVEIRDMAYIYTEEVYCAGGMPVGTAGRGTLLISGGIDSPVAGYMMARRGLELSAVHFYSYPYTSERARDKVVELTRILSTHSGAIRLHLVPFTDIQLKIYDKCPPKETTILMRRAMMRIAEIIARMDGAQALITGEALGQVASQTLQGLCVTDDAVNMPVFRPLIGFDKEHIVNVAKKIGSFETSILPYEDCCTIFVPQHPVTRPDIEVIRKSELSADLDELISKAVSEKELLVISDMDE